MGTFITDALWEQFEQEGYLRLGKTMDDVELEELMRRIDEIMLGTAPLNYDRIMMQLDNLTGKHGDTGPQSKGHKGATLNYRKIQELEFDPLFLAYSQKPLFREVCARAYGPEARIACFRAMFMNKPAQLGTMLPWHQDRWTDLDRDPQITIWTALDPATVGNGCVKIIPGSHRNLLNPDHPSGFLSEENIQKVVAMHEPVPLELAAGEAVVLHNWLLHSSEVNRTDIARRAFSVCYMDAATRSSRGKTFPILFGEGALTPEGVTAEMQVS